MPAAWSRRRFLGTTAATAAAATLGHPLSALAKPAQSGNVGRFSIGIQSYSLRGYSAEDAIRHAHDLGFAHMEFYPAHFSPKATPAEIDAMKKTMSDAGMKMLGHGVHSFSANHEANRKLFVFAKAAGVRCLSADPAPDSFESLDKLVKEFDIRIAIHNHGPRHRYNKALDVLGAVEPYDVRIGACADLGHFIRSGEDAVQVIRLLGKRLYGIHLKDFAEMKDKTEGVILGEGHLDVEGVFAALAAVDFPADGCLSLEYEENKDDPIDDIRRCMDIARKAAAKVSG
ncbi:MAG: sugar phosphate isomerase/epimerase [Planctomycetes bacterium]|nr:sugar phosphate isomerase/epimerase [Planctomycetota bacterium]